MSCVQSFLRTATTILAVTLTVVSASAQTRPEYVDCAASHRSIRQNIWTPPPGVTPAQFDYCHMVPSPDSLVSTRLTVRPHEMATGMRNPAAGDYPLDALPGYLVYVPPQCVGEHRCPLVVFLHWGSVDAPEVLRWQRPVANKYGTIVLAPKATRLGFDTDQELVNRNNVDNALKQVLHKFAVDPNRIALAGHCNSGPYALIWGGDNLAIFSRVLMFSTDLTTGGVDAPNGKTEFFMDDGFLQSDGMYEKTRELQAMGHRVKHTISLRSHQSQAENFDFAGRWLQESWEKPHAKDRTVPHAVKVLPVLTPEAITQMTTFWTAFQRMPEAIRTVARQAHQQEIIVPVGNERPSTSIADMPMLAKQFPPVAAALTAAGLTAEQHDAYRIALMSALVSHEFEREAKTVPQNSVQAKNLAFVEVYVDELKALSATNIWSTP